MNIKFILFCLQFLSQVKYLALARKILEYTLQLVEAVRKKSELLNKQIISN